MATGVTSWSQTAASNATADSAVNWAEGQAPSSVNDSGRAMMASVAKYRDDNNGTLTTGGTSTAFTVTSNQGFASLSALDGQTIAVTMNATSGATPTLNVDSLGAKSLRLVTGTAPPTGAFLSGGVYHFKYSNSNSEFLLKNQVAVLPSNVVQTASITDANVTYAKIQNVAASRLLGNPTGSPAAPSEISLGGGLAFSSTTLKSTLVAPTKQVFTSGSGTYTTPANCTFLRIIMVGGGGGGGGGQNASAGSTGGNTTFSTFTASGGVGGSLSTCGAGGAASGGNIANIAGGAGGPGTPPSTGYNGFGGQGGSSFFGGGGAPSSGSGTASAGSANSGAGGGGGGATNATTTGSGGCGGGSGGLVIATIASPSATYSYSVGASGGGASGGSSGSSAGGAGGAGAAGIIIVEEYY